MIIKRIEFTLSRLKQGFDSPLSGLPVQKTLEARAQKGSKFGQTLIVLCSHAPLLSAHASYVQQFHMKR
jgi:hypothetical protein